MSRLMVVMLAVFLSVNLAGCGKKYSSEQAAAAPEAVSIEELSAIGAESKDKTGAPVNEPSQIVKNTGVPEESLTPLPAGPYKPSVKDIQTALKNAGYYAGKIDGKSGPATKKAIEDFQTVSSLEADGKVGPRTWAVLSQYLSSEPLNQENEIIVKKDKS